MKSFLIISVFAFAISSEASLERSKGLIQKITSSKFYSLSTKIAVTANPFANIVKVGLSLFQAADNEKFEKHFAHVDQSLNEIHEVLKEVTNQVRFYNK